MSDNGENPKEGQSSDFLDAWSCLTEEERELVGKAIDLLVWAARPRISNLFFRTQHQRDMLEMAGRTVTAVLSIGHRSGFRSVELFATLATALDGRSDEEQRQLLLDFVKNNST